MRTEEVYLHCAKAFLPSHLWDPAPCIDRAGFATFGAMLKDQIAAEESAEDIDRHLAERCRTTLY